MIYVIVNLSHEIDDWGVNESIDFITTSLEMAEEVWEKYYSKMSEYDNSKWHYIAELREYNDGYFIHGGADEKVTILKSIEN